MRLIYTVLTYLLSPFAFAMVLWRGLSNRHYWSGLGERFGFGAPLAPLAPLAPGADRGASQAIWLHAVSLGEVTAAATLIRELQARHPDIPVVLTTATPTGRVRGHALFGDRVAVRYLPYDTPGALRRFLARVRPRLAIVMETELWPNLFHQCRCRGIPIVLANARLSRKSVVRYRRFGALFRDVFSGGTFVAAQTAADAERFAAIGAPRDHTRVVGNLKFDFLVDRALVQRGREWRAALWSGRPVWIAGSTHTGEEEMALTAHAALAARVSGALLLLVPRHPERFGAVADLLLRRGIRFERRSDGNPVRAETRVLLVDTVGELAALYAAVDAAFVGGSLVPVGGHNLLEPAALGVPVITGPYQSNGRETAQLLLREGAALEVADAVQLAGVLEELLTDPERRERMGSSGRDIIAANRGSVARLLELIEPLLAAHP